MNLAECVEIHALKYGNSKAALISDDSGERWTYADVNKQINRIANGLQSLGIAPGSRVAVMLRSRPELIFSSFAVFKTGCIYVSINSRLKEKEIKHILINSGAEILICDSSVVPLIKEVRNDCKELKHIVVYGDIQEEGLIKFSEWIEGKSDNYKVDPDINEVAAIMYTGGTTGVPKGVVLTHAGIIGNSLAGSKRLLFDENTIIVIAMPMFHIGGLAAGAFYCFLNGATIIQQEFFNAVKYAAAFKKYKATVIYGVPTFYYSFNSLPESHTKDFSSAVLGFSGAGVFATSVRKAFEERFGVKVYQYYGLTENSPGVTVEDPLSPERNYESVGTALPGVEIKIVDENDSKLLPGEHGELCVRGPYLMTEYWKNPDATSVAMRGGWLHTGDQGVIDEKGHFYIMGRKHDMILVGGANVYPAEVEGLLLEADKRIQQIAVVGVADERLGEIPRAFVVMKEGFKSTEKDIIELARANMAPYKTPRSVVFLDALPTTSIGKIDKRALQNRSV
ncbi:MAG: Long-chain-fatty-acid--CoA ligase [Smithella sp. PtaU1.Bin162]|nr:MAG: Long-chain-fatty-acid--CoA ligase [Smithella sp. PtaU1.Bin162]